MSSGDLTKEEVAAVRSGADADPSSNKVVALADVFGVERSYFFNGSKKTPIIDPEILDNFQDETVSAIAHKSLHLPNRKRETILSIIRQFENTHDADRSA